MLNSYPLWKYLLIVFVLTVGAFYAAPNLYAPDPAVQIAAQSSAQMINERDLSIASKALDKAGIAHFGEEIADNEASALICLENREQHHQAQRH